jgi:hypothetical protein
MLPPTLLVLLLDIFMHKMMTCDSIYVYKHFIFTDVEGRDSVSAMNPIYTYGHEFSKHLARGLADNWSQVSKYLELSIIFGTGAAIWSNADFGPTGHRHP